MRILFWNTHNNDNINNVLADLIVENNISIAVLAEYTAPMQELLAVLELSGIRMRNYMTVGCKRIQIIGSLKNVEPEIQSDYMSMQIVNQKYILCGVHLPSNRTPEAEDRREIAIQNIIGDIRRKEIEMNAENTILCGDFNMNPYEKGCVSANKFHGLPIYDETKRKSRVVANQEFFMFYNPMWNFLGDYNNPPGTYYYSGSSPNSIYWYLYDQVLIRPGLRDEFIDSSLEIITQTHSQYLLDKKGHPDVNISDHLPIMFEIKEDL